MNRTVLLALALAQITTVGAHAQCQFTEKAAYETGGFGSHVQWTVLPGCGANAVMTERHGHGEVSVQYLLFGDTSARPDCTPGLVEPDFDDAESQTFQSFSEGLFALSMQDPRDVGGLSLVSAFDSTFGALGGEVSASCDWSADLIHTCPATSYAQLTVHGGLKYSATASYGITGATSCNNSVQVSWTPVGASARHDFFACPSLSCVNHNDLTNADRLEVIERLGPV